MPTPKETPLLLDVMLGKLATYLRMCGYDAAYALDRGVETDPAIRELADEEDRLLLTRDADLADRTAGAVLLEGREIETQLAELREPGFRLALGEPTRCSTCNGELRELADDEATPSFAPSTAEQRVWRCRECDQPFWRGSHWDDVGATLAELRGEADGTYRPG